MNESSISRTFSKQLSVTTIEDQENECFGVECVCVVYNQAISHFLILYNDFYVDV